MSLNIAFIIAILLIMMGLILYVFRSSGSENIDDSENNFTIEYLRDRIKEIFNQIINENPYETISKKIEAEKREKIREQLDEYLSLCGHGDKVSKAYIKDLIKSILQRYLNISEETIDLSIPFYDENKLTTIDKFEIILHALQKKHGSRAFEVMMIDNKFDQLRNGCYEVTKDDINSLYKSMRIKLTYLDKLDILTQRIYSLSYGIGIIDDIRDMVLDGISAGLSGLKEDDYDYIEELLVRGFPKERMEYVYNSIWVLFKGKTIHLSCIGFESEEELERVAKKIYKFDASKYLSENDPCVICDAADGARIVVSRPKASENWAFYIRKFNSVPDLSMDKLITDPGAEKVIALTELLIKGYRSICISGEQTAGKTTFLKSACMFIDKRNTLRIDELMYELHLKKILHGYNIHTMRPYGFLTGQDLYEFFKKTDGSIAIIGEAATPVQASYAVQYKLSGFKCVLLTNHSNSAEAVIETIAFGLMEQKIYTSVEAAQSIAAKTININVHMAKTSDGHIFVDRITEIIPITHIDISDNKNAFTREFYLHLLNRKQFETRDLLVFDNGEYVIKNRPSKNMEDEMFRYYTEREKELYNKLFDGVK